MNFLNILSAITYAPLDYEIKLDFIGKFIEILINLTNVGVGIILFTLALKLIVLPFDIYSKVKMKQNSVKMEQMRPELEKLQKQYANDKNLYNQKMLALQKKNGYSPMSGCLPMILSLVIFIVAINSFRTYSAYSMKNEYNDIIAHYNTAVEEITVNKNSDIFEKAEDGYVYFKDVNFYNAVVSDASIYEEYKGISALIKNENGELKLNYNENGKFLASAELVGKLINNDKIIVNKQANFKIEGSDVIFVCDKEGEEREKIEKDCVDEIVKNIENKYFDVNFKAKVNEEVKTAYENGEIFVSSFLWVKNVWLPDVSYEHPVKPTAKEFQTSISSAATQSCNCSCEQLIIPIDENVYNKVTEGLAEYKAKPNGYFVMVVLSIVTMLLSQFIAQKMQKSQMELQSVDGQAAMTQKMMLWMMPMMFGMFAFSYSTAFSIYMTISSVVSTASSFLINLYVEKKYNKPVEITEGRSKKNINQINKAKAEAEEAQRQKEQEKQAKKQRKERGTENRNGKDFLESGNNSKKK